MKTKNKQQFKKENWWICNNELRNGKKCKVTLGKFIDKDRITIWGTHGEEYEIGFNYICLVCKECGKKHHIKSTVPDDIKYFRKKLLEKENKERRKMAKMTGEIEAFDGLKTEPLDSFGLKSFYSLPSRQRDKLLSKLSEKQKGILKILSSTEADILEQDIGRKKIIEGIAKEIKFSPKTVEDDISAIDKKIKELFHTPRA